MNHEMPEKINENTAKQEESSLVEEIKKVKVEEDESFVDDRKPEEKGKPWYLRVPYLWGLGATMAIPHTSEAKTPTDTLETDRVSIERMVNESPAPYELINTKKDFGHVSLEGLRMIPQSDTTKEFFVAGFSDDGQEKNVFGKILSEMKQLGYEPANASMLERIYGENKDDTNFKKYSKWMLAPIPESDEDDTRWDEKILKPTKHGTWEAQLPEHGVWVNVGPSGNLGRWEIDQGYDTEHTILFFKKAESSNTVNYTDFAKSK